MKNRLLLIVVLGMIVEFSSYAQTPWDEVMMGNREVCVALMYEHSTWNRYWEGTYLRSNANIGTLTRQVGMPMVAVGIHEKINLIASLPYISTEPSGGTQVGQKGIQDFSISMKINWLKKRLGNGHVSLLSNTNFNVPVGNYLSDYMPFSIGVGSRELGMRGIGSYRTDGGLVVRVAAAYLLRGQTEIERNYYYQNGSVYSNFMNVPNAVNFHGALGYWLLNNQLRVEATFQTLKCLTGDDIRAYNTPQPTNKMEATQVGTWIQYYVNGRQGLGVLAYFNQTLNGRNMGKASALGLGLTYQFEFKKQSN